MSKNRDKQKSSKSSETTDAGPKSKNYASEVARLHV